MAAGFPISIRKRSMVIKQEAARGTLVTHPGSWADADFDIEFFNIAVTKELAEYERMYALGDHDSLASVFGKKRATVTASVDLRWSGTNDAPPNLAKCLYACGLVETISASTSVTWNPDKDADLGGGTAAALDLPFDIVIQDEVMGETPLALGIVIRAALANGKIIMDEGGQPLRLDLEFVGVLHDIKDIPNANIFVPTGLDTTLPDTVLAATITAHAIAKRIDKMELDFGNVIELENDPADAQETGYKAAYISERHPVLSIDPLADLLANDDYWARWKASTEGVLVISTDHLQIDAGKIQLITNVDAEQNGARSFDETYKLLRDSANGHPWIITHT
jgi:hypothetical protein